MRTTDRALIELLARASPGPWGVGSTEEYEFYIYTKDSSPIRYVMREIPETVSNYDLRLMALARELAEEVLELRRNERKLKE